MNPPTTHPIVRGVPLNLPGDRDLPGNDDDLDFSALKRLPSGEDLPYDDGEPMETPWHRDEMNLLIETLTWHWHNRDDYFVGGNMFVYFSDEQVFNKDFRGPDFFVVKGVERQKKRFSWITWKEGGRYPDVIIELLSPTTAHIDRGEKKRLYAEVFHTKEYFLYDPETKQLEGWRLIEDNGYAPITPEPDGRMHSLQLDLLLGGCDGAYIENPGHYLRFFTHEGALVLTFAEAEAQRANAETQRANTETQRANTETQRANTETRRANTETQRANTETQRANTEAQRANTEAQRADAEASARASAEAELARLKLELEALRQQRPPTTP